VSYQNQGAETPTQKAEELAEFYSEAVVVCDNYSDFLCHTLPHNKQHYDRMLVVTSPEDTATRRLCEYHHVECLPTDVLESRWNRFCKGKGINVGLAKLSRKGWVTHLDADILLPPKTRDILSRQNLDKSMLYGIDRCNVKGYKAFDAFMQAPRLQHETESYIHLNQFPMATRVMHRHSGGYVPIGFYQQFFPTVSNVHRYPEGHTNAGREDFMFGISWPRAKRTMLPEIVGLHLESVDSSMSLDWAGRKSAPFTHESEQ
jgi:hypothetical protein